jgi:predicted ATP-grasp superfamily ATP-dependent carboligase
MSVLITSAKNRIAYAAIRSLAKQKIKVITADYYPWSMSFYSRYSSGHFVYPSPYSEPDKFIETLIKKIRELQCDVLMPMYDETYLIAKYRDVLSTYTQVPVPDYQSILTVHQKDKLMERASRLNISIPKTQVIDKLSNPEQVLDELNFPVVVKPNKGGGAWGVLHIPSKDQFMAMFKNHLQSCDAEKYLVQEKVNGRLYCIAMLFDHGRLKASCTYKQLREFPITGGTATLRESVRFPPIETALFQLLSSLQWHGICQADFIVNEFSEEHYLLDVNPRFWGSLWQTIYSGVDFPYLLYRIACRQEIDPVFDYKLGVKTRWIWGDFRALIEQIRFAQHKLEAVSNFVRFWDRNTSYDDFCLYDPLPFFIAPIFTLHGIISQHTLNPVRGGL